jgi:hypothetical protein
MTGTATTFGALVTQNNANVRKALKGGVLVAPMSQALPSSLTIDSPTTPGTPVLQTLTGFTSLGFFDDSGAVFDENINSSDIAAWGELAPVRRDITSDVTALKVTGLETNKTTLATYFGVDATTLVPDATTAELQIPKNASPVALYYRVLVLSQDGAAGSEYWIARMLPRASLTNIGSMTFASKDTPIAYDMEFTAYKDATAGYSVMTYLAGPGWKTNKTGAGF